MLPYALSSNADSDRFSSAPLELCTPTLYLTVAQPAVVLSKPLVTVAVLGASVDVTVTVLDCTLLKVEVVFGHLGYVSTQKTPAERGFQALLRLMKDGKAWVKLTAPYRLTMSALPYPDTDAFAAALLDAAPQRLLWGSDWPHVFIKSALPDDAALLRLFERWVTDETMRRRILVENPATLYGFAKSS